MSIRVALHHTTEYRYDRPVTLSPHVVRLRPAPHARTPILSYSLNVRPATHFLNWQQDPYGNYLARLVFLKPAHEFVVSVDLVADMTALNPFDFFVEEAAEKVPFAYDAALARELTPYFEAAPPGPRLAELVAAARQHGVRSIDHIVDVNRHVQQRVKYLIRMEPGVQTPEETLTLGSGSCRDSAWLLVQLFRHLGVAARFVSGYLIQLTADEKALDGPSGPEADFTDLHAWAEVFLPGAGWVGLDPTSGLLAGEGHIPLACSAEPTSAAAITGSLAWEGDDELKPDFSFRMQVTRIRETPRVTKPYTEAQWAEIELLGHDIDADLEDLDVRLTMGGEPTFVSVDNRDGAEWNTAALGPEKRHKAGVLLRRLRDKFAPQGLLHFGQGKWYPGESLPRWALGCYWRRDGEPVWLDPSLVGAEGRDYGYTGEQAGAFVNALARRLEVDPAHAIPGYEDAWYYMWRERRLPTNVDPLKNRIEEEEERARIARVFDRGLKTVVGHALPLRREWQPGGSRWVSGPWFLRREHLFLIPGDSPMGFRLPLDSLPWAPAETVPFYTEQDAFGIDGPLPPRGLPLGVGGRGGQAFVPGRPLEGGPGGPFGRDHAQRPAMPPARGEPAGELVRTALVVEPRAGHLHVFMPPQRYTEDYLELVAAVEATAAELAMPVLIEGYAPPNDPRLNHFKVTPDPGVIEVNVHPTHSWEEMVRTTNIVYEEARQSRLCAEKFMLDGRHTGTGGGNHIVLGGPTPADSPILRRPDLLRSLVAYWHNHPSLSYLFSGLFVGPTSQAPRVDDARNDALYEMELAFRQVPGPDAAGVPFWLVDRVFRNLLVDVTGNTHRAEFCIDKLYSPDGPGGRHGLVEMRAFEMPPHARMSLTQQLLLRALVARFWREPYDPKLVRWGTELHDRFMLPHFVWQDFRDVLDETRRAGYPVRDEWFAPHLEFRFPKAGEFSQRDVRVELRTAIEPWHVLGEEAGAGGTVRYVDSSLERVQVKVAGMVDPRHVLTCNGRRVPLAPTGTNGEYVAGVRYRAWQPPSCLHPTLPVNVPLVFDLMDTWMDRSAGGCTYHVAHPGGRSHDTFPVNANEAEGRRTARFFAHGHTQGPVVLPPEERHPEFPLTLDLRQPVPPVPPAPAPRPRTASGVRPGRRAGIIAGASANGTPSPVESLPRP